MTLTVAIMQPTYIPWLGYFALMDSVDAFVLMDDVQFDKRSWQQRNRVKTPNGPIWLTVPVLSKGRFHQRINEVHIDNGRDFPQNHIRTIEHNYRKASHFDEVFWGVKPLFEQGWELLCEFNMALIERIRSRLGIGTRCIHARDFEVRGVKAERLINLCRTLGATHYISPLGSRAYLEETDLFKNAGIELSYQKYEHPTYPQLYGAFEPNCSVIDLMMNVGAESLSVIRSGVGQIAGRKS